MLQNKANSSHEGSPAPVNKDSSSGGNSATETDQEISPVGREAADINGSSNGNAQDGSNTSLTFDKTHLDTTQGSESTKDNSTTSASERAPSSENLCDRDTKPESSQATKQREQQAAESVSKKPFSKETSSSASSPRPPHSPAPVLNGCTAAHCSNNSMEPPCKKLKTGRENNGTCNDEEAVSGQMNGHIAD